MSVFKLDAKSRNLPWRAVVSRKGQPRLVKQFRTLAEAELWEQEHKKRERLKDVPGYQHEVELRELAKHSVKDLIEYYIAHNPQLSRANRITLNVFLRDEEELCSKSVLQFSDVDVNWFVEKKKSQTWSPPNTTREPKPITPRTIRRFLNCVQRVFTWSVTFRHGFKKLPNPFSGIRVQGSTGGRRERALEGDELERILEACKACHGNNSSYVSLAIFLAIDTAMRRQEIFNLWWSDIDEPNRRIKIRKSKTDKVMGRTEGTTIVLPAHAKSLLIMLAATLPYHCKPEEWTFPKTNERIFPMTVSAFSQSWYDVVKRAGIEDLHFHDLRRTANTRFIQAGLTVEERSMMLRHSDKSMQAVYIGRNTLLKEIQDKLDRFVLNGLTLEEALKEKGAADLNEFFKA